MHVEILRIMQIIFEIIVDVYCKDFLGQEKPGWYNQPVNDN